MPSILPMPTGLWTPIWTRPWPARIWRIPMSCGRRPSGTETAGIDPGGGSSLDLAGEHRPSVLGAGAGSRVAEQKLHPHGHGWSIVNNVDQWSMGVGPDRRARGQEGRAHGAGKTGWGLLVFQTARMALLLALVSPGGICPAVGLSPLDPLTDQCGPGGPWKP